MELNRLDSRALQIKTTNIVADSLYQVNGGEISWVSVQPKTGATFFSDVNSHKFAQLLGIYSKADVVKYETTRANGGLLDTAIGDIGTAYNSSGLLVGNIASQAFRASIHQNVQLTIPITGGTGSLSGLTSLTLYSAFIEQKNSKTADNTGPCATWKVDSLWSESHPASTYQAGIGYAFDPTNNPSENTNGEYRSGIVHLFTDSIDFSGATTGTTWSTGWSGSSRYTHGGSPLAKFDGPNYNKSVGMLHVDSGVIVLYNPDIVTLFDQSKATGGTITSGLTFPTSDVHMKIKDRDVTSVLNINITLEPETHTISKNKSVTDAKERGVSCEGQVSITEICLYDDFGKLVGIAIPDTPIIKRTEDYTLVTATVTLDGGTKDCPCDDGRTTYS